MRTLTQNEILDTSGGDAGTFVGVVAAGSYVGAELGAAAGCGVGSLPGAVVGGLIGGIVAGAAYIVAEKL